jgi:hypothetical protein
MFSRNYRREARYTSFPAVRCARRVSAIIVAVIGAGCSDTYEVTEFGNPVQADPIDDTAPATASFDPSLDYHGPYGETENHSAERFRFDVMPYEDDAERQRAETIYPSHALFLKGQRLGGVTVPSVQTIVTYVKQIDDTIYAGVEQTVEDGLAPTVESKRTILRGALDYLSAHRSAAADEAFVSIAAASRLGGDRPTIPSDLSTRVDTAQSAFLASPAEAKPIGFYSWSDELKGIWQQDRMLQRLLPSPASTCALAVAIAADPARRMQYENLVALYSKLTNPVKSSLVALLAAAATGTCATSDPQAFLSASRTPEDELFEKLYPGGVPPEADLMGDLITAIRAGAVDLAPTPADGWYEYQLYALETLLVTDKSEERAKIGFTARYKKRLQEAFSTLLVQHRETHVKQTGSVATSAVSLPPTPHFRLEPLATVYVRHARSYVFIEHALEGVLGASALDTAVAVGEKGNTTETLRTRIRRARDLFYGLYLVSSQDLGFKPALGRAGDPSADQWGALSTAASQWLVALPGDELAASDVRVMVPIAQLDAGRYKYWAVIGVRATLAGYSFIKESDMSAPPPSEVSKVWLPTEQFLEVESSNVPLSRDELRALCDEKKTAEAIKASIEARR